MPVKKNKVGALILPNFKTYSKMTIIKTVWYWGKSTYIDREESRNTCKTSIINLPLTKKQSPSMEKLQSLQQMALGQLYTLIHKNKFKYHLYALHKITVMPCITFWSTINRIYNSGLIRLKWS